MEDSEKNGKNASGAGMYELNGQKTARKGTNKWLIGIGAVVLAVVFFLVGWFAKFYAIDERMRTLMWMIDTLDKKYYEDVDLDQLYDEIYDTVVPDKFSGYMSPEEYATLIAESQGTSSNFGFALNTEEEIMRIARVVGNSSADNAGIKAGMYLYRFGTSESDLRTGDYAALTEFIRGKGGRDILFECGYSRETARPYAARSEEYLASYCEYRDSDATFKFRGTEELELREEGAGFAGLPADTAYIRLYEFEGNAAWEFVQCLQKMSERRRTNLVLDLRYNGGGYLSILQSIASHFIKNSEEPNPVVATAKYRNGKVTQFRADGNDYALYFNENSKITVLADENSASASECLIGSMVDYGAIKYNDIYLRRTEDGTAHSYGKGVMQSTYVTLKGDAFRLTTAKIYWPSGKSIHGVGVTQDDGAHAVEAPLLPDETDLFLKTVFERLSAPSVL